MGHINYLNTGYAERAILGNHMPLIINIYVKDKIKFPPAETPSIIFFILRFKLFSPFPINQV